MGKIEDLSRFSAEGPIEGGEDDDKLSQETGNNIGIYLNGFLEIYPPFYQFISNPQEKIWPFNYVRQGGDKTTNKNSGRVGNIGQHF